MAKYIVTGPDGVEYEVNAPEGATEQDVMAYVQSNASAPKTSEPSAMDRVKSAGRAVGGVLEKGLTGVARGVSGAIGLPGDVRSMVAGALPEGVIKDAYQALNLTPTSADARKFIFQDVGLPERQAESTLGKIAQTGVEGLTAGVMSGGLRPLSLAMGFGAGAGSEAGSQAFPESKVAPAIGAIAGGGIPYALSRFTPGVDSLVRNAMRDTAPRQVDEALRVQQTGRAIGSPVTGPEALNSPELLRLQRTVERSRAGGPLNEMVQTRPAGQYAAVRNVSREIAPSVAPREAKQGIASAAKAATGRVERARTDAASPFYREAATEAVPATILDDVIATIDDQLTKVGTESGIGKQLIAYKDKVTSAIAQGEARVGPLDAIYKETRDAIGKTKLEPGALDKEVKGILRPINSQLGNALSRGSQNIAMGRAVYQQETPAVKAVAESVGDLIPRGGAKPTIKGQATALLSPENARPDTVSKAMRTLSRENPEAVSKWIGAYVDTTMDTAMKRLASGNIENAGGKFYTAIAGTPMAKANLRAAFNALPSGSKRWNALENTLKVFEAQSRRLPVGSATSENIATAARLSGGAGPRVINWIDEALRDLRFGRNTGKLAEIFARTDSVDELVRISRLKPGTKEAADAVGRFVALETQAFRE